MSPQLTRHNCISVVLTGVTYRGGVFSYRVQQGETTRTSVCGFVHVGTVHRGLHTRDNISFTKTTLHNTGHTTICFTTGGVGPHGFYHGKVFSSTFGTICFRVRNTCGTGRGFGLTGGRYIQPTHQVVSGVWWWFHPGNNGLIIPIHATRGV